MPGLEERENNEFVKLMYIGDSSTGKTGSLVSLLKAGYKLRILDMDNGIDSLHAFAKHECPDKIKNVKYETFRDKMRAGPSGLVTKGGAKAYTDSLKVLTEWPDGTDPAEWGPDTFFVLDSLTAFGRAAYLWAKGLNPTAKDKRNWYGDAQEAIENVIAMLTGDDFRTNVIIISHVDYQETQDGSTKGFATAIGKALGPKIPRYFNTLVLSESSGSGKHVRRKIKTVPTGIIDLKTPVPFAAESEYDLPTGMAEIVSAIKNKA